MDSRLLFLITSAVFSQVFAADGQPAAPSLENNAEFNADVYENADLLASNENKYNYAGVRTLEEQSLDSANGASHYRTARSPFFGGYGSYGGWGGGYGGYGGWGGYHKGYYGGYGGYGGYGYGYPSYGYHHYPYYRRGWHRWY